MSLVETIKSDSLTARKAKDSLKATLLTTLYSEVANVGKNNGNRDTTDAEAVAVVKKFLKGVDETVKALMDSSPERFAIALAEQTILEQYLPKQLSEDEIRSIVVSLVNALPERSAKQMGAVMKEMKALYEGQYDGQVASRLIKEALA